MISLVRGWNRVPSNSFAMLPAALFGNNQIQVDVKGSPG